MAQIEYLPLQLMSDKKTRTVNLLGQLVREEGFHAKLAEELIKICRRNRLEFEVLLP